MIRYLLPLLLLAAPALAQTTPGFVTGQVPTAGQWNAYFAGKTDVSNGTLGGNVSGTPTFLGDVTLSGAGTGLTVTNGATVNGTLYGNYIASNPGLNVASSSGIGYNSNFAVTPYIYGTSATQVLPIYWGITDQANMPFTDEFHIGCNISGTQYSGGRNCFLISVSNTSALPNDTNGYLVGFQEYTGSSVTYGGLPGKVGIPASYKGALFGGDFNASLTGGKYYELINPLELDQSIDANSSTNVKLGMSIVLGNSDAKRGDAVDAAIQFAKSQTSTTPGWLIGLMFGGQEGDWPFASDSTAIASVPRTYSAGPNSIPLNYGVDWRYVTFTSGGCSFASPGYCINPSGQSYSAGVVTTGNIQSQTATLSSITINDGGAFDSIPTLTVQAPPTGTTATATVSSMGLSQDTGNGFYAITSNGTSGCTNGATVTVSGGTSSVVATGTTTVVGGVVTSIAVAAIGTYTALPTNPVTLTGSGCSGTLAATLTWGITGMTYTGGSGYLLYPAPTVTPSAVTYLAPKFTAVMAGVNAPLNLNPSGGNVVINGSTDGSGAGSGNVGQIVTQSASGVSLTSATPTNITSVSLPAGDWDVWTQFGLTPSSSTITTVAGSTSTTSAGLLSSSEFNLSGISTGNSMLFGTTPVTITSSSSTTFYAVEETTFSGGSVTGNATITARRRR